jgi:uncharacterized membrane protein YbhN (UPF0104 family)
VRDANKYLLTLALFMQLLVYTAKALRWHAMVCATNMKPTFGNSWHLYNIGVFLATITPAKLGEFGKVVYLKKKGLPATVGIALVIVDRLADVIVISLLGIVGIGILFGKIWSLIAIALVLFVCLIALFVWKIIGNERKSLFKTVIVPLLPKKKTVIIVLLYTILSWILYFGWAVQIAHSVEMNVPIPILISAFTITGILSLLPIAPAGLGTRDAALLVLLAAYGVSGSQAVALALLMFCSILVMGIPGGFCWLLEDGRKKGSTMQS